MSNINRNTYQGKGRPRKSDYIMGSGERDYDAELVASSKRAQLGEAEDGDSGFGVGVAIVVVAVLIISWEVYSRLAF